MKKNKKFAGSWGFIPIIVFILLWEITARILMTRGVLLLPPFSHVVIECYQLAISGVLGSNLFASLLRVLTGLVAGAIAGITFGTVMGWNSTFDKALNPVISLFYPIPALGWLPLLMLWIGINEMLPITIIFICAFFPILYNTVTGIKNVGKEYIKAARSLGASDWMILKTVVLPLALPNIFTGLKLEAGMAWRTVLAAEMVAIPTGIGALLMKAESLIRVDIIIVCLIVLAVMSLSFEKLFEYLEQRLMASWR